MDEDDEDEGSSGDDALGDQRVREIDARHVLNY